MKLISAALLLGAVSAVSGKTSSLRSSRKLQEVVYGTYLEADIQYADHSDGHVDAIELPDGTILDIEDDDDADDDVKNRGQGWFRKHGYKSGNTEIALTGRVEGSTFKLKKLPPAKGKDKRRLEEDRRRLMEGTKTVLALRAIAPDASTSSTVTKISDEIFGTADDAINLSSQYTACSHGKLNFVPAEGSYITNGVGEVTITQTVTGVGDGTVRNAVTAAGDAKFGRMKDQFDHVMECLPPGTSGGWIAYAYINHWLSVYNDVWCNYPSAQLHELGHNINLAHSGEGTAVYADQSGMMGYSYSQDEGPIMCFNAAKNYQLGWFSDRFTEIDLTGSFNGAVKLIGQADYTKSKDLGANDDQVGIRIFGGATKDYYVSFNRKTGNNAGTVEGGNQVLVHERDPGVTYAQSWLVAKLNAGGTYKISDTNGSLDITVDAINTSDSIGYATISIVGGCSSNTDCDDQDVCTEDVCDSATGQCSNNAIANCCNANGDCSNGLLCIANSCVECGTDSDCDDGNPCTVATCANNQCSISNKADGTSCDDGLFCNGSETCNSGSCTPGAPPTCDDGVSCTIDNCNASTDSCDHSPSDALCDNNVFCDGAETCSDTLGCQAGTTPDCGTGYCDSTNDVCVQCLVDGECDDGLFCNGVETCSNFSCQAGTNSCAQDQICIEESDTCVECLGDGDCSDGDVCNGLETCVAGSCVAGTALNCPDDNIFCNGLEFCDPIGGCQSEGDPCSGSEPMCDETGNQCVECFVNSDCDDGNFCNGSEICSSGVCQSPGNPCGSDQICNEETDTCDAAPVDIFICSKRDPGTGRCADDPPFSDPACINNTCGRGNKCWKVTCSTGAPGPTPSPPPGPEPSPSPPTGPTCDGLSKGDCKATPGCTGSGNGKSFTCNYTGGAEFCFGKNIGCSTDSDCCSGRCKGNDLCA